MVAVAQLVESQIVILVVVGSSPIGHPTEYKKPGVAGFFVSERVLDACLNGARHADLNTACAVDDVGLIGEVFCSDEHGC